MSRTDRWMPSLWLLTRRQPYESRHLCIYVNGQACLSLPHQLVAMTVARDMAVFDLLLIANQGPGAPLLLVCWHRRAAESTALCFPGAQVQAFHKLNQPAVTVKARESDASLVQGVLESARSKYKQTHGQDAPTVAMAEDFLPGPPSGACGAGVITVHTLRNREQH